MRPHSRRRLRPSRPVSRWRSPSLPWHPAAESTAAAPPPAAPATPISVSYADVPPALNLVPYAGADPGRHRVGGRHERAGGRGARRRRGDRRRRPHRHRVPGRPRRQRVVRPPRCRTPFRRRHSRSCRLRARRAPRRARLEFVAVALTGANAGAVVARQRIADPSLYLELPVGVFGNAAAVSSTASASPGAVMIGHVDVSGSPVTTRRRRCGRSTRTRSSATARGRGRWTSSGTQLDATVRRRVAGGTDHGRRGLLDHTRPARRRRRHRPTMPVIAVLSSDGTGSWHSMPTDWQGVAATPAGRSSPAGSVTPSSWRDSPTPSPTPVSCRIRGQRQLSPAAVSTPGKRCGSPRPGSLDGRSRAGDRRLLRTAHRCCRAPLPGGRRPRRRRSRRSTDVAGADRVFALGIDDNANGVVDPWEPTRRR